MIFTLNELNNSPMTPVVKGGVTTNTKGETEWHPAKPIAWSGMKLCNRIKAAWLVLKNEAVAVRWY